MCSKLLSNKRESQLGKVAYFARLTMGLIVFVVEVARRTFDAFYTHQLDWTTTALIEAFRLLRLIEYLFT
jgi:hypothetical protein